MRASVFSRTTAIWLLILAATRVAGQDAEATLASPNGATLRFAATAEASWTWAGLTPPGATEEWRVTELPSPVAVNGVEVVLSPTWTIAEQTAERIVFEQLAPEAGLSVRRIFSFGPARHVVRIETWARSLEATRRLTGVSLLDIRIEGETFRQTGAGPASFPLFGQSLFAGAEHISGDCRTSGDDAHVWQTPHAPIGESWQFIAAVVIGWVPPGDCSIITGPARIRDAFLQYLDTIRVQPADLELHTNTWWSLPLPFSEADVLRHIESLRQGFSARTGMFFDSFALDLGWSDKHSIWKVATSRFPSEFRVIDERLRALGSRLGLWVSPGSAYPEGLDNQWLITSGYEVTPFGDPTPELPGVACFAAGGRYQREFKENLLRLVRDYGIRHVKLDFMAHSCDVASHGHPTGYDSVYAIDAGLADVLDSLRALNPNIVLEPLCTGYPPSPWWTTKTPYVLGPYGDDVPYGRVPSPEWMESLISARDIAYRQDQERWIMPTQAVETIDIVVQSPGQFENLAVMAIGRGRWFLSTYIKPELMTPQNWDFLAALVRWARANKKYLTNALPLGGKPEAREAYGYLFHQAEKDIYCARNPWIEARTIELPHCSSVSEPRELRMIYPRRETIARLQPGDPGPQLRLGPYETVILESIPVPEDSPPLVTAAEPVISLQPGNPPYVEITKVDFETGISQPSLRLLWNGDFDIQNVSTAELCVLVESGPEVDGAACVITVDGRTVTARSAGSARQFGAAALPSPENWKWFIVPVTAGTRACQVFVEAPLEKATVGIFLRGTVEAGNDPAPAVGAVFPVWRATERPWSFTLVAPQTHGIAEPAGDAKAR